MGLVEYDAKDTQKQNPIYYTVSYIGTMGAYFVLAKDEVVVQNNGVLQTSQNYLNSCGINLLQEKHKVYTTLFQTQTESMFSQEKYQCIIQDTQPTGVYKEGTRWFDSDAGANEPMLYEYKAATKDKAAYWDKLTTLDANGNTISANPTDDELYNYENYQRYLDNFNKLKAVQSILVEKERQATYCRDGYKVDTSIVLTDGSANQENIGKIISAHFNQFNNEQTYNIIQQTNDPWILYTFKTSYDPFVYSINTKPYNSVEQYYLKPKANIETYEPIAIDSQEEFDKYNGSLYVVTSGHNFAVYLITIFYFFINFTSIVVATHYQCVETYFFSMNLSCCSCCDYQTTEICQYEL